MARQVCRAALAAAGLACLLLGCQSLPFLGDSQGVPVQVAAPPVERLSAPREQAARLETGRAIYLSSCTKCHQAKAIYAYTAENWSGKIIPKMAKKAQLQPEETEMLRAYVLAARAGSVAAAMNPPPAATALK